MTPARLEPGVVAWANLSPTLGREQRGKRPVVIVASDRYLQAIPDLVIVLPITTKHRGLPNHVPLSGPTGLAKPSYAMTEQLRTISKLRLSKLTGSVDRATLDTITMWLTDWLIA